MHSDSKIASFMEFEWISNTVQKHILLPMPAAAKYSATGEPRPPAPTTKIDDLRRFCCPAQMIIQAAP